MKRRIGRGSSAMLRTEGIDHVSLEVADPARSARWYAEILGLERRFEEAWGDVPIVMGSGTTSLALFRRAPDAAADRGAPVTSGFGHVAFRVDHANFERAAGHLEAHGIEVRAEDYGISHSLHFADPDGNHLEITTYEVAGPPPPGAD